MSDDHTTIYWLAVLDAQADVVETHLTLLRSLMDSATPLDMIVVYAHMLHMVAHNCGGDMTKMLLAFADIYHDMRRMCAEEQSDSDA